VSIAWEDQSCHAVCAHYSQRCVEDCWPFTADGLEHALDSHHLKGTCFGLEPGDPQPWHPAKDPENTMCYWLGGNTASQAPRCRLTPETPPNMLANAKVWRRFCPCVNPGQTGVLNCGLGGQPTDPAPNELGWVEPTTKLVTTTAELPPLFSATQGAEGTETPPAPPPAVFVPEAPKCQELCVSGFTDLDTQLNGRYVRLSGDDGGLKYWSRLGMLDSGFGCRLHRGPVDGIWRYLEAQSDLVNISVGEGTLRSPVGTEIPEDDYVLTPTGGSQVSYQCCPVRQGSDLQTGDFGTAALEVKSNDSFLTIVIAVSAALLCILPAMAIFFFRRKCFGQAGYQDFNDAATDKLKEASLADPEASRGHDQANPGFENAGRAGQWRGREVTSVKLDNRDTDDRSASAIADVLGRSAKIGNTDGIYEGPTRNWWKNNPADPSNPGGLGGTGFQIGQEVRLRGLQSQPTWNGSDGVVEGYDPMKNVLSVKVQDGRTKLVSPENCISMELEYGSPQKNTPADIRNQLNAAQMGFVEDDRDFKVPRNSSFGGSQRAPNRSSSNISTSNINYYDASSNNSPPKLSATSSLSFNQTATNSQFAGLHQADRQMSQTRVSYNGTGESFGGPPSATRGRMPPPPQVSATPVKAKVQAVEVKGVVKGPAASSGHTGWSSPVRHEPGRGPKSFSGPPKLPSPPRPSSSQR